LPLLQSAFVARRKTANLDSTPLGRRALRGNRNRFFTCAATEQKEAADHFLGFRKGTIEDARLAVLDPDARGIGM
jgi:hypothetical protein